MPMENQLDLIAALRIVKQFFPELPWGFAVPTDNMKYRSDHDKLISILSWIALFFNINQRHNVAVALKFSRQELPSLIISTDQGSVPSATDETIMDKFKTLTFQAFKNPKDIDGHALAFYSLLAQQSWQPIQVAIMKIQDKHFLSKYTDNINQKYLGLMERWMYLPRRVKKNHINEPSREKITSCFDLLLTKSEPNAKEAGNLERRRAQYYVEIAQCCKTINGSKFFAASLDGSTEGGDKLWQYALEDDDKSFLFDLRFQIRDILVVSEGAETYLKDGLEHLQALYDQAKDEDSFKRNFHFTWTGQTYRVNIPQDIKWTKTPLEWITAYANEKHQPTDKLQQLSGILPRCWKKGEVIQYRLHSEVAILDFVLRQGIQMKYDVIGTAQPPCWACRTFIDFRGTQGHAKYYRYRMEKAEFPEDWLTLSAAGITENDNEKDRLDNVCKGVHPLLADVVIAQTELEGN